MTQDIIEMARQAGFNVSGELILDDMGYVTITNRLEAFAKLVAAKALAKQEQGEPVAIALNTGTKQGVKWLKNVEHGESLYTTPQQRSEPSGKPAAWVGLTDEEIWDVYMKAPVELDCSTDELYAISRTVEAKLKEKNTTPQQRKPLTYCQECMRPNPADGTACAHGIKENT